MERLRVSLLSVSDTFRTETVWTSIRILVTHRDARFVLVFSFCASSRSFPSAR